jgi:hypothetical protein
VEKARDLVERSVVFHDEIVERAKAILELNERVEKLMKRMPMNERPKEGSEIRVVREGVFRSARGLGNQIEYWQYLSE